MKKFITFVLAFCLVLAMATCFATSSGEAQFISTMQEDLTADNLWGAIAPFAQLIVGLVIFGFSLTVVRKVLKGYRTGKPKV